MDKRIKLEFDEVAVGYKLENGKVLILNKVTSIHEAITLIKEYCLGTKLCAFNGCQLERGQIANLEIFIK